MKKISKIAAALVCAAAVLGVAACATTGVQGYKSGTYTGTAKGFGGDVKAVVTIADGKIVAIAVTADKETEGIGSRAAAELPASIVKANSADVDGVSGASYSSKAVKDAVRAALVQASGKPTAAVPMKPMKAGVYKAQAKGYAGNIAVEVAVSERAIDSVKITDNFAIDNPMIDRNFWAAFYAVSMTRDTPQILKTVEDRLPARIVAAQSLDVDVITGATSSSRAVLAAVAKCVAQAGGDPESFAKPVAKSVKTETYDCDVVVVGGGTSGSSAAAKATEAGARVILIEKSGRVGGTGALSSEPMTVGWDVQKKAGIEIDEDALWESIMAQNHWAGKGWILRKFLDNTADTVTWLGKAGGFNWGLPIMRNDPRAAHESDRLYSSALAHYNDDAIGSMGVANSFAKLVSGVHQVMYETTGKSLIQAADGKVTGVVAERWDGTTVRINAKAVVIATGGFAGSKELMAKYNGSKNYTVFGLKQNVGEGLEMALKAGAAERHIGGTCAHLTDVAGRVEGFDIYDTSMPYNLSISPTILRVTPRGERFVDENEKLDSMLSSSAYCTANGAYFYSIVSKKQIEELKAKGLRGTGLEMPPVAANFFLQSIEPDYKWKNVEAVLEAGLKIGLIYKGATLDELAKNAGMNARILKTHVARYNDLCKAGKDADYNKPARYLDALGDEGPYYAVKGVPLVYNSLGGVDVDEFMQVLRPNGTEIAGLYAAGLDSIGAILDGVTYPDHKGVALGWGFNSGKLAGMYAAEASLRK